jgi:hypothetical protein
VAVAERFTTAGDVPSLPCTVIVPVTLPLEVGVKATIMFPDCPAAMDIGNAAPDRLNCGFEKVAWVMEITDLPVLEIATDWVLCFPTLTFPKLTLLGLTWNAAWMADFVPVTTPAQPFSRATESRIAARRVAPWRAAGP